jgi:hypothetical protein
MNSGSTAWVPVFREKFAVTPLLVLALVELAPESGVEPRFSRGSGKALRFGQITAFAVRRIRSMAPRPANPAIMRAQLVGSGTAAGVKAMVPE